MSSAQQVVHQEKRDNSQKDKRTELEFEIETITPDVAAEYLETSKSREEKISLMKERLRAL